MSIRTFRDADTDRVLAIALQAWQPIYEGYRRALGPALFDFYRSDWQARKQAEVRAACQGEDHYHAGVMEIGDEIAGFITYRIDPAAPAGVIGNNALAPAFQGRGLAAALYRFALDHMRAEGVRFVSVVTGGDEAHAPARRAYEKIGFGAALPSVTYHLAL